MAYMTHISSNSKNNNLFPWKWLDLMHGFMKASKIETLLLRKCFEPQGWQPQAQKRIHMIKVQPLDLKRSKTPITLDLEFEEES